MSNSETWANVAPNTDGVRTFASQMLLDKMGMAVLTEFFETHFAAKVSPANTKVQLRGVDICVSVPGRSSRLGPVGIDAKVDGGTTGNMAIELISQDRPNSQRDEPAEGYIAKDSAIVAYYFPFEGKLVLWNMALAYPWLNAYRERLIADAFTEALTPSTWMSATPNETYLSYNLIAPVCEVLDQCPGTLCLDVAALVGNERHQALTGTPLQTGKIVAPADALGQLEALRDWLLTLPCYDIKPQLGADDKERLIRVLAPRARFKRIEKVRIKGQALQSNRVPRPLPEDPVNSSAAS